MSNDFMEPQDMQETQDTKAVTEPSKANKHGKKHFNSRRWRYGSASLVVTVIVIVGILLFNIAFSVLADKFPISLDLSQDKIYTISEDSVAVAKSVVVDTEIIIFTSESYLSNPTVGYQNGIPEFDTTMTEFYNVLKQYQSHSDGKVTYRFIDADQDPTLFAQFSEYNVNYGSVLLLAGDGRYKAITVDDLYNIEYNQDGSYNYESRVEKVIGSAINTLNGAKETLVQVLVGHNEDATAIDGLQSVYGVNGYTFQELSIIGSAEFNKDAEIALIAAPSTDYSQEEIKRIQSWMYNNGNYGHHLMVFINPLASCPNLYEFLEVEYQIRVEDQIILENDPARVFFYDPYNTLADVPSTLFTSNSDGTAKLLMPEARRLSTMLGAKNEESSINTYGLSLSTHPESAGVAVLSSDSQSTEIVSELEDGEYPLSSAIAYVNEGYNNTTEEETYSTVLVFGSPLVAYDTYVQNGAFSNEDFLLDSIKGMVSSDSAVTISTKNLSNETVVFDGLTQLVLGYGVFTFGLPFIILIIGLITFIRRIHL